MQPPAIDQLSLREKIGQTCQVHGEMLGLAEGAAIEQFFAQQPVGSLFLGSEIIGSRSRDAAELQRLVAACQKASRVPLSVAGDLENGAGGAIRGLTAFPNLLALAATDDPAAAYDYGRLTALEAARAGFNWTFGPVVDLSLNWLNPIVSTRSLGQSPQRVAELAAAFIRGAQDHGLSATAKHFPGDGVDFRDQHLCVAINALPEDEWDETFGYVFRACATAGVHAVMAGHIALPWIESGTGTGRAPLPATTSRLILRKLLRDRLDYDGVIVSDALIMAGFRGESARREDLIVEAFNAGIDVMLWPGPDYIDLMECAIADGRISEKRLNESVRRILAMKEKQGLFDAKEIDQPGESITVEPLAEAVQFGDGLAERSVTLVENRRELLPLDPAKVRRLQVLLATPFASEAEKRLEPLLKTLRARGIAVDFHVNGNCLDLRRKEQAGERFDALIVLFEQWTHSVKNTMRPAGAMAECIWTMQGLETMEPIIVSLGSPYLLHDVPWAETYVNAYSSRPSTLRAIGRALFGEIPFAGKSPVHLQDPWKVEAGRSSPQEEAALG